MIINLSLSLNWGMFIFGIWVIITIIQFIKYSALEFLMYFFFSTLGAVAIYWIGIGLRFLLKTVNIIS